MDIVFYLMPIALGLAICFLILFALAVNGGQFEDLDTPAHRILLDDRGGNNDDNKKHD